MIDNLLTLWLALGTLLVLLGLVTYLVNRSGGSLSEARAGAVMFLAGIFLPLSVVVAAGWLIFRLARGLFHLVRFALKGA